MVRTSPGRTVWLGLAALARLTRTLPSGTSCAARVRDLTMRAEPEPLVEPLGLGRLSLRSLGVSSSCRSSAPDHSWLRFSRAALSELSAANGEIRIEGGLRREGGEACMMRPRPLVGAALGPLAAVIAAV